MFYQLWMAFKGNTIFILFRYCFISLSILIFNFCLPSTLSFPKEIVDYPHSVKLNPLFELADSLKYKQDLSNAEIVFADIYKSGKLTSQTDLIYGLNQLAYLNLCMRRTAEAQKWVDSLESVIHHTIEGLDENARGDYWYNKGLLADQTDQPQRSRDCLHKARIAYEKTYGKNHLKYAQSNNSIGAWYLEFSLDSAYAFVQEANDIYSNSPILKNFSKENKLNMAKLHFFDRGYIQSKDICTEAINLALAQPYKDSAFITLCYCQASITQHSSISNALLDLDTAKLYLNPRDHKVSQEYYNAYGEYYANAVSEATPNNKLVINRQFMRFLDTLRLNLGSAKKRYVFPELLRANYYLYGLNDKDRAIQYCKNFLLTDGKDSLCGALFKENALFNLTKACIKTRQYQLALQYAKQSLLLNTSIDSAEMNWDQLIRLKGIGIKNYQFITYGLAASTFLERYKQENNDDDLKQAYNIFMFTDSLLLQSLQTNEEAAILRIINSDGRLIYSNTVETLYLLHKKNPNTPKYLNDALKIIDRQKSFFLYNYLRNTPLNQPKELRDLLSQIRALDVKINVPVDFPAPKPGTGLPSRNNDPSSISDMKYQRDQLRVQLKDKFPQYGYSVPTGMSSNINEALKNLPAKQTVLEYFIGEENTYVLCFHQNPDTIVFSKICKSGELNDSINKFSTNYDDKLISASFYDTKRKAQFTKTAHHLFQLLLKEVYPIIEKDTNIVIIPDKSINFVNFDVLLANPSLNTTLSYQDLPYLVRKHNFVYSSSFKMLSRQTQIQTNQNPRLLALYNKDFKYQIDNLSVLYPMAKVEDIEFVSKIDFFKQLVNTHDIIHISAHGISSTTKRDSCLLTFDSTQNILGIEILQLKFENNPLVVLAACEGALGPSNTSEIPFSISRFFLQAGASMTISSVSTIDPKAIKFIIEQFYSNLNTKKDPTIALWMAKNTYLKTSNLFYEPYYWSGLVCFR